MGLPGRSTVWFRISAGRTLFGTEGLKYKKPLSLPSPPAGKRRGLTGRKFQLLALSGSPCKTTSVDEVLCWKRYLQQTNSKVRTTTATKHHCLQIYIARLQSTKTRIIHCSPLLLLPLIKTFTINLISNLLSPKYSLSPAWRKLFFFNLLTTLVAIDNQNLFNIVLKSLKFSGTDAYLPISSALSTVASLISSYFFVLQDFDPTIKLHSFLSFFHPAKKLFRFIFFFALYGNYGSKYEHSIGNFQGRLCCVCDGGRRK